MNCLQSVMLKNLPMTINPQTANPRCCTVNRKVKELGSPPFLIVDDIAI